MLKHVTNTFCSKANNTERFGSCNATEGSVHAKITKSCPMINRYWEYKHLLIISSDR